MTAPVTFPILADVSDVARITFERMQLRAPVGNDAALQATLQAAQTEGRRVALHGRRHSQGGHVLLGPEAPGKECVTLDLELMQKVKLLTMDQQAWVCAGAMWHHLHVALDAANCWLAPATHQSSPYFSIGGSLAVNCHGRDPMQPPLAGTVKAVQVMLASGEIVTATRDVRAELFKACLGGFGGCGVILSATLVLKPERQLTHQVRQLTLAAYQHELIQRMAQLAQWPAMHHAWLNFSEHDLLTGDLLAVDSHDVGPAADERLNYESFLSDDGMGLVYGAYRKGDLSADALWDVFKIAALGTQAIGKTERMLNAMRANVRFSAFMGVTSTDLLQEFFLPADRLTDFLLALKQALQGTPIKLLTGTVRIVQQDDSNFLSYAAAGPRVSVVINFNIKKTDAVPDAKGDSILIRCMRPLIDEVTGWGGSYYLPYLGIATLEQFRAAYPRWQEWMQVRDQVDPGKLFDNAFLRTYLV